MNPKTFTIFAIALVMVSAAWIHEGFGGWSAECYTTWSEVQGQWLDCVAGVIADMGGPASLTTTAPACNYPCQVQGWPGVFVRFSRAGHGPTQVARANCSNSPVACPQCWAADNWGATAGEQYWVRAYNYTHYQACGPTKGRIQSGSAPAP